MAEIKHSPFSIQSSLANINRLLVGLSKQSMNKSLPAILDIIQFMLYMLIRDPHLQSEWNAGSSKNFKQSHQTLDRAVSIREFYCYQVRSVGPERFIPCFIDRV